MAKVLSWRNIAVIRELCCRRKSHHTSHDPPEPDELAATDLPEDATDWTYDPSEPRYCVCNQVS